MLNECFENHTDQFIFASIWVILSLVWNLLTFVFKKRYSVILHLVISGLLVLKSLPALLLIICFINFHLPWLSIILYICEAIISILNFSFSFLFFFVTSIGMGTCDLYEISFHPKQGVFSMAFCYIVSGIIFFFPLYGSILGILLFQYTYVWILSITLNTVAYIRDKNPESRRQVKILHHFITWVFFYCQIHSAYYTIFVLNSFFEFGILHLNYFYLGFELVLLAKVLYVLRPRLKAGYSQDLLFPERSKPADMIQANFFSSHPSVSLPGCLVVFPVDYPIIAFGSVY